MDQYSKNVSIILCQILKVDDSDQSSTLPLLPNDLEHTFEDPIRNQNNDATAADLHVLPCADPYYIQSSF